MIPFIDLNAQQTLISTDLNKAINKVLEHGQYIMGPEVGEFEQALNDFCSIENSISCANGTDALVLALMALGIGEGDAVFAPSFTFVATIEAIRLVNAIPVFIDVDKDTFNISTTSLEEAINYINESTVYKPKAIIPVDLFGQTADYIKLEELADFYKLFVISDAAQSFGAEFKGKKVGGFGTITTTSFFPAKPLGCYGDGGAVFTNDSELAEKVRSYRNHGQGQDRYDNVRVGLNSRLDTIQAAILLEKLKIFPSEIASRNIIAQNYTKHLPENLNAQSVINEAKSVWAQYTVVSESRDLIREHLQHNKIPTAVYYPRPNHLQVPYEKFPVSPNGLKVTEYLQERVFSLPMHPYIDENTQDMILTALSGFK